MTRRSNILKDGSAVHTMELRTFLNSWSAGWDSNPCITALQAAALATSPPALTLGIHSIRPQTQNPLRSGSGFDWNLRTFVD